MDMYTTKNIMMYHKGDAWSGKNIVLTETVDRKMAKVFWQVKHGVNSEIYYHFMQAVRRFEELETYYDKEATE